jgi:hypothetical protein
VNDMDVFACQPHNDLLENQSWHEAYCAANPGTGTVFFRSRRTGTCWCASFVSEKASERDEITGRIALVKMERLLAERNLSKTVSFLYSLF